MCRFVQSVYGARLGSARTLEKKQSMNEKRVKREMLLNSALLIIACLTHPISTNLKITDILDFRSSNVYKIKALSA
jgi:hypothetical protein